MFPTLLRKGKGTKGTERQFQGPVGEQQLLGSEEHCQPWKGSQSSSLQVACGAKISLRAKWQKPSYGEVVRLPLRIEI